MNSLNGVIDRIYVLTIERNMDRHPNMKAILNNINFEFWYGVDAKQTFKGIKYVSEIGDDFFIRNNINKEHVSRLTLGQFGAYFSIKKMIDHIAISGYNIVLNFEDDVKVLNDRWQIILKKAIEELPADWDLLLLGYNYDGLLYKYAYQRRFRMIIKLWYGLQNMVKKRGSHKIPVKFSKHLDQSGFSMGGHAYCLSKKGASLLSSYLTPMRESGDILFSDLISENKIKAFSVYPCLFLQDPKFGSKTIVI